MEILGNNSELFYWSSQGSGEYIHQFLRVTGGALLGEEGMDGVANSPGLPTTSSVAEQPSVVPKKSSGLEKQTRTAGIWLKWLRC